MRIKLYTKHDHFARYLNGHTLVENQDEADLLISYDWPKKIDLKGKPGINMHISLLPYNRGTDPNFWSWLDGTPKGVTIHWMDDGIDTGPIAVQKTVDEAFLSKLDIRSSYEYLHYQIEMLFAEHFPKMLDYKPQPQDASKATLHRKKDGKEVFEWLVARGFRVMPEELIRVWGKKSQAVKT